MSVADDIQAMSQSLVQGEGRRISRRTELYSAGVNAKLRNAQFAWEMLRYLSLQTACR